VLLTNTEAATRLQAEHTMVDGIIALTADILGLKARRSIEISKMRGSGQLRGMHTLEINEHGITVRPRIESMLRELGFHPRPASDQRRAFGVEGLDRMLFGGLTSNSNTMLMGPSGTGKTIFGMHFLNAGAEAGEKGLLFSFYERPEEIHMKAQRLGMTALAHAIEAGTVKIIWQSSVEANIDRIGAELLERFNELVPSRIFLDGIHGFEATLDHRERIQDFFAAITDYFANQGATFLFTAETHDLVGEAVRPPFSNASRMCHNIVLLRYCELQSRLDRIVGVIKMRDSNFDPTLHAFSIEDNGAVIAGPIPAADQLLLGQPRLREDASQ
jgi:circadian clock protein KaiC